MTLTVSQLGPSCPRGGRFYVCQNAAVKFLGCCQSDPCADGSGVCPTANLTQTTFSSDSFEEIPPQSCDVSQGANNWYTCKNTSPPFMGCCSINPCQSKSNPSCPTANLLPARLSPNATNAAVFTTQGTPAPQSDAVAVAGGLSPGVIAGIVVGGVALIGLIVLLICCLMGWRLRNKDEDTHIIAHLPAARINGALPDMNEQPAGGRHESHAFSPNAFSTRFDGATHGAAAKNFSRSSSPTVVPYPDDVEAQRLGNTSPSAPGFFVSMPVSPASLTTTNRASTVSGTTVYGQYARVPAHVSGDSPEPSPGFSSIAEMGGDSRPSRQSSPSQHLQPQGNPHFRNSGWQQYQSVPGSDITDADAGREASSRWRPYRP